jgi:hypothetical protein
MSDWENSTIDTRELRKNVGIIVDTYDEIFQYSLPKNLTTCVPSPPY